MFSFQVSQKIFLLQILLVKGTPCKQILAKKDFENVLKHFGKKSLYIKLLKKLQLCCGFYWKIQQMLP